MYFKENISIEIFLYECKFLLIVKIIVNKGIRWILFMLTLCYVNIFVS